MNINGVKFKILGDPHLGRRFVNGVPLNRRGEREKMQWATFEMHLHSGDFDVHVCMGDLFDKTVVPYDVILRAASVYNEEARNNPQRTYVILMGNHDGERNLERSSAFDVFDKLITEDNVLIVRDRPLYQQGVYFFPWHPVVTAAEMVGQVKGITQDGVAFGHWDVIDFGNDNPNMIPIQALKGRGIKTAITGHDHKPRTLKVEGLDVVVTGSMQPYAHGEEIDDTLYVTAPLADVIADPDRYADKCLRVLLQKGEVFDVAVDYLQLTIKREGSTSDGEDDLDMDLGSFDLEALISKAFEEEGVSDEITAQIRQTIIEKRITE